MSSQDGSVGRATIRIVAVPSQMVSVTTFTQSRRESRRSTFSLTAALATPSNVLQICGATRLEGFFTASWAFVCPFG